MTALENVPHGYDEIVSAYGHPDRDGDGRVDTDWWQQNMRLYTFPFPLRLSWGAGEAVTRQYIHKAVGDAMIDALAEIGQLVPPQYLTFCNCDRFGGIFNYRRNRRNDAHLSTHSWGIAIDINPHLGPLGGPNNQPYFIRKAFRNRGFNTYTDDAMHMEACTGY